MTVPRWPSRVAAPLLLAIVPVVSVQAQEAASPIEVHGFGSWAYGRTNGNEYLSGDEKGRYDDGAFSLNVAASPADRLRVVGQTFWEDGPEGTEIDFDFAFAEWTYSDKLKLRAGKVPLPFGISSEVFDVGTLRPFLALPQVVYGPVGIVGESYTGVGLTGSFASKGGWGLTYDVFGGGQHLEEFQPPEAVARGEDFDEITEIEKTRDMIGGRLELATPLSGLRVGGSFYTGRQSADVRRSGFGLQAEYLTGPWSVRSELAHETVRDDFKATGFYGEAAYRFDPHWQVAAQYGRFTSDLAAVPAPAASSLLDHEEMAVGLNYWWNHNFVFKLSFHRVDGNRLAGPDPSELAGAVAAGTLKSKTNLVAFGAQFSF
jgi:phosphate-selective porin O/P